MMGEHRYLELFRRRMGNNSADGLEM